MLVLVTGWRDHPDQSEIHRVLEDLFVTRTSTMVVIHGACTTGADQYADVWAQANAVSVVRFPAEDYGRWPWCGPRRNKAMVRYLKEHADPDKHVVAFPSPDWATAKISGTRICIQAAMLAGFEPAIYPAVAP